MAKPVKYPQKVLLQLDDATTQAVTDYRFKHRLNTMSEAYRELISAGLAAKASQAKKKDER